MPATTQEPSTLQRLLEEMLKIYNPSNYLSVLNRMYSNGIVEEIKSRLPELPADIGSAELPQQIQAIKSLVSSIQELDLSDLITDEDEDFPRRFNDYLIADYLRANWTGFYHLASMLGWIRFELDGENQFYDLEEGEEPIYGPEPIAWERLPAFFNDPAAVFSEAGHQWGTDAFANRHLFLLYHLKGWLNVQKEKGFPPEESQLDTDKKSLTVPILKTGTTSLSANLKFILSLFEGDSEHPKDGIKAIPEGGVEGEIEEGLVSTTKFSLLLLLQATLKLSGGVQVEVQPSRAGLTSSVPDIAGEVLLGIRAAAPSTADRITLLGSANGNKLDLKSFSARTGIRIATGEKMELVTELDLREGRILIQNAGGDGFLNNLLPKDGIAAVFDLLIGWSSLQGIYFRGAAGLEVDIPAHIELGPVEVLGISLGVKPVLESGKPPAFDIPLATEVKLLLGPFTAVVENMGIRALLSYQSGGGNLGPMDLDLGFKPPNGIGLSLETPSMKGGGYLFFDFDKGEYAGVAELVLKQTVAVKAIGIIQTKKPDGSPGFSFLLLITAEFKPIQLGYGFTLNGVGGLIAINRGMNLDALATGVRTNAIDAVMFPDDPIAEAPRIIADLNQFFPVAEGRYTFGLMGIIGWGTPTLISLELGLIIQVPDPVQLAILGVVRVQLPDKLAPIVNLQANFIGAVDFEKGEMFFFATLFESNLEKYRIEGQMYFAISWGDNPNFIFSVGGFHPAFRPPPLRGLSRPLKRITINLLPTDNPRLTIKAYFAVTSNTVQFGASIDFYFKVKGFKVIGYLYLDALFRFNPFFFTVEIGAGLAVMSGGSEILSIHLRGTLSGPTPWHINGRASFKVLLVKVKVRVNKRFGRRKRKLLPPRPALPLLLEVLRDTRNWEARLPANSELQVSFRQLPEESLILHPAGQLSIRQDRLPLGMRFHKIGNERPSDFQAFQFQIDQYAESDARLVKPIREFFAPAEFLKLNDSQKLSRRPFERMQAGLRVAGSLAFSTSGNDKASAARAYRFEQRVIDGPDAFTDADSREFGSLDPDEYEQFAAGNAVARSAAGRRQIRRRQEPQKLVKTEDLRFVIASQGRLRALKVSGKPLSYGSEAEALVALQTIVFLQPRLSGRYQVVPSTEIKTA